MADYIPTNDGKFGAWANNFLGYAGDHLADLGLAADDLAQLSNMKSEFNGKMAAHITAGQAGKG